MPLPGWEIDITDSPPVTTAPTDTGVGFAVCNATIAEASVIYSQDQFVPIFGARDPASPLYDWVENFFHEGGSQLYLATAGIDAVEADIIALLATFDQGLGPGQIAAPGYDTVLLQKALMAHAENNDRVAVLDGTDTAVAATLETQAAGLTGQTGDRFSALFAPWDVIPGIVTGTTRTVPPSGRIMGNIARNDGKGLSQNKPAAGALGKAQYVQSLSQSAFTDSDRQTLNEAGVNISRMVYGGVRTYGWRSLASQSTNAEWSWFSNSRLIMAIKNRLSIVAENFAFSEDDGAMINCQNFGGAIVGELIPFYNEGSLFGATPADAFTVDSSSAVNTDATLSAGELHAKVALRCSKFGETVKIDVAKVPITQAIVTVL